MEANKLGAAVNPAIVTIGAGCVSASPSLAEMTGEDALRKALGG
jgi:hypothetical protein